MNRRRKSQSKSYSIILSPPLVHCCVVVVVLFAPLISLSMPVSAVSSISSFYQPLSLCRVTNHHHQFLDSIEGCILLVLRADAPDCSTVWSSTGVLSGLPYMQEAEVALRMFAFNSY